MSGCRLPFYLLLSCYSAGVTHTICPASRPGWPCHNRSRHATHGRLVHTRLGIISPSLSLHLSIYLSLSFSLSLSFPLSINQSVNLSFELPGVSHTRLHQISLLKKGIKERKIKRLMSRGVTSSSYSTPLRNDLITVM